MESKKYFIGTIIQEPFLSAIEEIKQHLFKTDGLKGSLRSPAHITLHRPFEWKESKEKLLVEKLSTFDFKNKFNIELKDYGFFEPRVVFVNVLPNKDLYDLHNSLKEFAKRELQIFNESDDLRGFHPHVTIASRDLKKAKFPLIKEVFSAKNFSGSFPFIGISLFKLEKKWELLKTFSA